MKTLQRWRRIATSTLVCAFTFTALAFGQQAGRAAPASAPRAPAASAAAPISAPQTPKELFARARKLSDLEAAGVPFHLKATFVASGDTEFTGDGTIEEWWESKNRWRREATLKSYRWVQIDDGADPTVYSTSTYIPLRLRQAVGAVPIQFPSQADAAEDWKLTHRNVSGIDFVILSKAHKPDSAHPNTTVVKAYFFSPEGILRIQQYGDIGTFYNKFKPFHNLAIPDSVGIASREENLVSISVNVMESWKPDEKTISKIPSLPKSHSVVNAHVSPSWLTHQTRVDYPLYARQEGIQGTVVVAATIDDSGKVREPYILSSAGKLLDEAALDSIRHWRYRPRMVDGQPVDVQTIVIFDFRIHQ